MNDFERVYYEIFLSKKSFFHFFVTVVWFRPYSWKSGCLKILKKSNAGEFFLESVRLWDPSILLLIFLNLSKATFGNFRVLKGNKGLNLLSQYVSTQHTRQNSFRYFEAKLWKCYYATMNSPHLTFFAKLTQYWRREDVVNLTWYFSLISTLQLHYPWYIVRWTYYPTLRQRCHFINLRSYSISIIMTLWIWRYDINVRQHY